MNPTLGRHPSACPVLPGYNQLAEIVGCPVASRFTCPVPARFSKPLMKRPARFLPGPARLCHILRIGAGPTAGRFGPALQRLAMARPAPGRTHPWQQADDSPSDCRHGAPNPQPFAARYARAYARARERPPPQSGSSRSSPENRATGSSGRTGSSHLAEWLRNGPGNRAETGSAILAPPRTAVAHQRDGQCRARRSSRGGSRPNRHRSIRRNPPCTG